MAERPNEYDVDSGNENTQMLHRGAVTPARRRDWRLFNVVLLGITFLFLFTAFQTCSMVQVSGVAFISHTMVYYLKNSYITLLETFSRLVHKACMPCVC